jgi:hypothetical protein
MRPSRRVNRRRRGWPSLILILEPPDRYLRSGAAELPGQSAGDRATPAAASDRTDRSDQSDRTDRTRLPARAAS